MEPPHASTAARQGRGQRTVSRRQRPYLSKLRKNAASPTPKSASIAASTSRPAGPFLPARRPMKISSCTTPSRYPLGQLRRVGNAHADPHPVRSVRPARNPMRSGPSPSPPILASLAFFLSSRLAVTQDIESRPGSNLMLLVSLGGVGRQHSRFARHRLFQNSPDAKSMSR